MPVVMSVEDRWCAAEAHSFELWILEHMAPARAARRVGNSVAIMAGISALSGHAEGRSAPLQCTIARKDTVCMVLQTLRTRWTSSYGP